MGTLRIRFAGEAGDAATLAAMLETAAVTAPPSGIDSGRVVLVRRARIRLSVGAALPEAAAVEAGRALEGALRGALRRPHATDEVRVFPTTAEYLTHFVEELAAGRVVDVWHFGPLLPYRGRGLGDTLANLARAEPDAWPEVLRLLRTRGLLSELLRRLVGADREVLRGVPPPAARALGHDEGWPLFLVAWDVAAAALGRGGDGAVGAPAARPIGLGLPSAASDAFRLYLDTHPAAPESWASPASLGACIAAMVKWIIRRAAAPADAAAGEAALARHAWIDPSPTSLVLREHASAERIVTPAPASPPQGAGDRGAEGSPALMGVPDLLPGAERGAAMNRTRALRFLRAARLLAGSRGMQVAGVGAAGGDPFRELESEVWAVDAAAAYLATRGAPPSADQVLALLVEGKDGIDPARRPADLLAIVAAATQRLDDEERRELAGALVARARARPLALETDAVGVFFLIRPLVDLGVPGLAARAGLPLSAVRALVHDVAFRAAGVAEGDRAAEVLAWGGLGGEWAPDPPAAAGDPRVAELSRALRAHAARLGLDLADSGEGEPAALLLEAACRQLVRWMRGFEASSVAFVLRQVVRRPGAFRIPSNGPVEVIWPASGLDVLLERAGYLEPLPVVPWWDRRGVRWER